MANIRHAKVSGVPNPADPDVVGGEDWDAAHSVTLVDGDIPASIARDSEVTAAVAAEATLARNADNLASGTVADARIASTIARDSEVTSAVGAEATARDAAIEVHRADTTNVHGITDTANVVLTGDARLSDARTPTGAAGGDLGGTFPNPTVSDDSHSHTAATLPAAGADLSGIDFLVGTASGLLSAEIPVGTTPGGELGGTWASPTVDASHSGSTHAATQAAAEATAAGALSTHAGAADPHPGYLTPAEGNAAYDAIGAAAAVTTTSIGAVPTARTITAGTGLTGGGDLSANRTLAPDFGSGAGKVTQGNDSRLSDSRTPTAHAASHKAGGSDDLSGVQNGFAPLSSGLLVPVSYLGTGTPNGSKFLRDDGVFAVPAGGGSGGLVLLGAYVASAQATLDMTTRTAAGQSGDLFQSDFADYQFLFSDLKPASDNVLALLRIGTGGGGSPTWDATAGHYRWGGIRWTDNNASGTTGSGGGATAIQLDGGDSIDVTGKLDGELKMFAVQAGVASRRMNGQFSYFANAAVNIASVIFAAFEPTTVPTAARFLFTSGNITSGTIRAYGIVKT